MPKRSAAELAAMPKKKLVKLVSEASKKTKGGVISSTGKKQRAVGGFSHNRSGGGDVCEGKWIDFQAGGTPVSLGTAGQVILDSAVKMVQGTDGVANRIGRKVTATTFQIKGQVFNNYEDNNVCFSDVVNVWIVLDRDPDGTGSAPAWSEVFTTTTNPGVAFINLNNTHRFRILKHVEVSMKPMPVLSPPPAVGSQVIKSVTDLEAFEWFGELGKLQIGYNSGNTGTISDITKNNIIVYAAASNCDKYFLEWQCRVRYTDE